MPACGRFSTRTRRTPSSIWTTADLLSAPRIVPPAFRTTPSSTIGSSGPGGGPGSGWAPKKRGGPRVEMGAKKEGGPPARRLGAQVDVALGRADLRADAVLVRLQAEAAEIPENRVGDGALLARRAWNRRKLYEKLQSWPRLHETIVRSTTCERRRRPDSDRP